MTAAKPVRRYMGRVEFVACKETIDSMLAQGFSKKLIHERLTSEGRCSMHYITFCEFIRNAGQMQLQPPPKQAENSKSAPLPVRPQRQPGIIRTGPDPFPDPKHIDPKTLI
jgi:hypothetical protein